MQEIINKISELESEPPKYRKGNFRWNRKGEVEFVEDEDGRFLIAEEPKEGESYTGGADPYDHCFLQQNGRRALGAICIVRVPDGVPVLMYEARPKEPGIFYEDCLMAAKYYDCKLLIENNKPACISFFIENQAKNHLAGRGDSYGITNVANSRGQGTNKMVLDAIMWHYGRLQSCPFPLLLRQILNYDRNDTREANVAMAYGFALISMMPQSKPAMV